VWLGNDDNTSTKKLTGGAMPAEIWNHFMATAHQGLPMADLPGMAGRTIEPAQTPAPAAPQAQSPLVSMLAPPAAVPLGREDDMRNVTPLTPLAPARPPSVVVAPPQHAQPRPAAPTPRPPQSFSRAPVQPPARNIQLAPQSPNLVPHPARTAQAAHAQTARADAPRPPGGIGYVPPPQAQPQPQRTADNNSGIGDFFGNLFGRR